MGFFDRLLSGKVFSDSRSAALVAEIEINNKRYNISELDWEFKQDVDSHHKPCSAVYGGLLSFSLNEEVDQTIYNWIINRGTTHSGSIRFYNNTNTFEEGAQMEIRFDDAICVRYFKQMAVQGGGVLTTLVISCRVLKMGHEVFEQKWSGY